MSDDNQTPPNGPEGPGKGPIPTTSSLSNLHTAAHGDGGGGGGGDDDRGHSPWREWSIVDIGEKLFEWRDYTPIPLIIIVLFACEPSVRTATLGTLLTLFGELIRIYSVAFIGSVSRTRNTESAGARLITSGPFSYVRNPLYVGNFFIVLGLAVYSGVTWIMLLTIVLFFSQYYCIVKHEERLLVGRFGREYEEYMLAVPAWVPTRLPHLEQMEWPDTFSPALRSERRTLLAIALMLIALAILSSPTHPV